MKELLTCEGLTKSYQKGTNALDDIELHIGFGRIVGLLGPPHILTIRSASTSTCTE